MTQSGHSRPTKEQRINLSDWKTRVFVLRLKHQSNKAKPAKRRGRKGTGPRFLREAMDDSPKDPKVAGLPTRLTFKRR